IAAPFVHPHSSALLAGTPTVVCGTVQTSSQTLIAAVIRLSNQKVLLEREASEYRLGLSPHLEQISFNFEELSYLRRLGEQIDLRDVSDPLTDLAERILGELRDLVKADGLGFLAAVTSDPLSNPKKLKVGNVIAWTGDRLLDDSRCAQLVQLLRGISRHELPVIQNQMGSLEEFASFSSIHSCIQVPVIHRGTCFGWLIGLNRIPWRLRSTYPSDCAPAGFCDDEFGTGEASLMNSAASTLAAHYRNSELFHEKELLLVGVVRALINAIDAKDSYTCGHSDRVAVIGKCIGVQMGLSSRECERLYMAGLLHDLGKIGIPDHVLCKPGKLTEEEFKIVQQHPTIGHSILNHLPQLQHVLPGVLHHHESVNGRGYPAGLREEQIPLFARILAVADSYDAMTSARPYRSAMPTEKAEQILAEGAGTQWDSEVVRAFFDALPAIEAACQDSQSHLHQLLKTKGSAGTDSSETETDSIARAVTAIHTS
ncbi:MAG: hypothetical protein JWM11_1194, partial [Planctomycetaceae bacterium]|nr:hypothetical protein [Planctomycetaceae bacterium]